MTVKQFLITDGELVSVASVRVKLYETAGFI